MFKNHLKIAWRSIKKEKLFSSIKIGGFALGITSFATQGDLFHKLVVSINV